MAAVQNNAGKTGTSRSAPLGGPMRGNIFQYQHHTTPINYLSYHAAVAWNQLPSIII